VRTTTQPLLGPLVLDKAEQVAVPAPINTFLREYQRDGVRFFYEQYKAGRGALLGDDMGLVRAYDSPLLLRPH
jgi:SNF2 family DNA or RNA helicase